MDLTVSFALSGYCCNGVIVAQRQSVGSKGVFFKVFWKISLVLRTGEVCTFEIRGD